MPLARQQSYERSPTASGPIGRAQSTGGLDLSDGDWSSKVLTHRAIIRSSLVGTTHAEALPQSWVIFGPGQSRPGCNASPARPRSARHGLRAHLHVPQTRQHLVRPRRTEIGHQGSRRRHLARQFDLEQKTLQTLDNAFGARLSPMSSVRSVSDVSGMDKGVFGGRGGIRTHGRLAPTAVFKTAALNHSATLPLAPSCLIRSDSGKFILAEGTKPGKMPTQQRREILTFSPPKSSNKKHNCATVRIKDRLTKHIKIDPCCLPIGYLSGINCNRQRQFAKRSRLLVSPWD